jgi:hypothetical protein
MPGRRSQRRSQRRGVGARAQGGLGKRAQRRGKRAQAGGISKHGKRAQQRGVNKRAQKRVAKHLLKAHVHQKAAKRILKRGRRRGGSSSILNTITGLVGSFL